MMRVKGVAIFLSSISGLAFLVAPSAALSQSAVSPFAKVAVESKSSVIIVSAANGGTIGGFTKARVQYECLTFKNLDRRAATDIVFHFRYYNDIGNHVGDDVLTRKGKFSTGVVIAGVSDRTAGLNMENCVEIHYPQDGISLNTFWVDGVTYDDGTSWKAADLKLPEHLPNWHPKSAASPTPRPSATTDPE